VTGHHGYIGSVLTPILQDAGHDVVGLDTFYYRGCDFGSGAEWKPAIELDIREISPRELSGFEAIVHLAAPLERSARRSRPRVDVRDQSRWNDRSRARRQGGGRSPVRLRLVVRHVWPCRRRRAGR
jgi:hypothetical protein